MRFTGQTLAVLRSILLASAALALGPVTSGGVPSTTTTSQKTTASRLVGASRPIKPVACRRSQPAVGGPSVLPVRTVRLGKGAFALVSVCIEGAGPFPFLIDSGSALSVVDTQLSRRFHLRQVGAPERVAGIGCSARRSFPSRCRAGRRVGSP